MDDLMHETSTNSPGEDLRMQTLTGTTVNQLKKKINFELNKY